MCCARWLLKLLCGQSLPMQDGLLSVDVSAPASMTPASSGHPSGRGSGTRRSVSFGLGGAAWPPPAETPCWAVGAHPSLAGVRWPRFPGLGAVSCSVHHGLTNNEPWLCCQVMKPSPQPAASPHCRADRLGSQWEGLGGWGAGTPLGTSKPLGMRERAAASPEPPAPTPPHAGTAPWTASPGSLPEAFRWVVG